MRISPKKRGEIYDLVHQTITDLRIDLRMNYLIDGNPLRNKIDCVISQVECPLAQKLIALVKGNTKNED